MSSVLLGIEVASALSDAILHFATMQKAVNKMLQDANASGGELSSEQIQQLIDMRHAAVAALDKAVANGN